MKGTLASFVFPVALVLCLACSSAGTKMADTAIVVPSAGAVHENVTGFTDKGISYALFIPGPTPNPGVKSPAPGASLQSPTPNPSPVGEGSANPGKAGQKFPVIVMFDPHGSGLLPVKRYRDLAQKYGFILVGSNDSKNGLPGTEIMRIISSLFREIKTVYPIDTGRIYMAGFSGGARVACIAAIKHGGVKGVIGCGAGFPGGFQPGQSVKFDYFGIAGTADFNMNEMLQLGAPMTRAGMRHVIITFPGPHEWPPSEVLEQGIQWITLNAMRDGTLKKDGQEISRIMEGFSLRITEAKAGHHYIAARDACREAEQFASGLVPAGQFATQADAIEQIPEYRAQVTYRENLMMKEAGEQSLMANSLYSKDLQWWKNRIGMMGSKYMKGRNPEDTLMNARLKAFLSLCCYSSANAALLNHAYGEAEKVIAVYELADPPNPEPCYMLAIVLASRSDNKAVDQLKLAVSKGFSDKTRLQQQPEFESVKNTPAWFDLLKSMK